MSNDQRRVVDRRMAIARELDELVERIRGLDGFEDFLRPPPLENLLEATVSGPVVVLNVSRWRCDALMVTERGTRSVPLRDMTAGDVTSRVTTYLNALQENRAVNGKLTYTERIAARKEHRRIRLETLHTTMKWLWDVAVEPILPELGMAGPVSGESPPRIWWCPTGLLSLLPVHGAGYHDAGKGRTVLDHVVSSYTPTLRALHESVRQRAESAGTMLFVGVPDAIGLVQLGDVVARERAALESAFPGGFTAIDGSAATTRAVSAALGGHRWVHMSCHGYQDVYSPSRAGLLLADGTLTIPQISAGRYAGEFAFLSACMTATGGLNLPDEAITLAAALSYTGYRHVIATLWSVHPATAARVTELVYPALTAEGPFHCDSSAAALHKAICALRRDGVRMDEWLPFTHTGP